MRIHAGEAARANRSLDLRRNCRRAFVDRIIFPRPLHRRTKANMPASSAKSIAVLPFENLSDDKQNTYFADGVQDQILTNLAKVSDLKVISHTSVRQYKSGIQRNLREIGQQLGVAYIVEGSVQRVGGPASH